MNTQISELLAKHEGVFSSISKFVGKLKETARLNDLESLRGNSSFRDTLGYHVASVVKTNIKRLTSDDPDVLVHKYAYNGSGTSDKKKSVILSVLKTLGKLLTIKDVPAYTVTVSDKDLSEYTVTFLPIEFSNKDVCTMFYNMMVFDVSSIEIPAIITKLKPKKSVGVKAGTVRTNFKGSKFTSITFNLDI